MNKLEEIKNGLKCWDDHFPLNPPESKTEELLREEIKRRAQTFHAQGIENVRYLLSIIEQYEHRMKITTVELQDWVRNFEVLVVDKEYMDATKKIIADNYEFHLQAIRGSE